MSDERVNYSNAIYPTICSGERIGKGRPDGLDDPGRLGVYCRNRSLRCESHSRADRCDSGKCGKLEIRSAGRKYSDILRYSIGARTRHHSWLNLSVTTASAISPSSDTENRTIRRVWFYLLRQLFLCSSVGDDRSAV